MENLKVEEFVAKRKERAEQKRQSKRDEYKRVYDDLTQATSLFTGRYDAENGDPNFMYGINTVMEYIAYEAGGYDLLDEHSAMFSDNMEYSEDKAREANKRAVKKKVTKALATVAIIATGTAIVKTALSKMNGKD